MKGRLQHEHRAVTSSAVPHLNFSLQISPNISTTATHQDTINDALYKCILIDLIDGSCTTPHSNCTVTAQQSSFYFWHSNCFVHIHLFTYCWECSNQSMCIVQSKSGQTVREWDRWTNRMTERHTIKAMYTNNQMNSIIGMRNVSRPEVWPQRHHRRQITENHHATVTKVDIRLTQILAVASDHGYWPILSMPDPTAQLGCASI